VDDHPHPDRPPRGWIPALTVALVALAALAAYAVAYEHYLGPRHVPVVRSDGAGYYAYLPAYLLQGDPTFHRFVASDLNGASLAAVGLSRQPATGSYLDKYTIGEAVMVLPFFLVGHGLAALAGERADGYSPIEQTVAGLAGLAWFVLGLWLLAMALGRYFGPGVTSATLAGMVFGTNLFHYGTFDSMFSHAYSFCLVAGLVELAHRWYASGSLGPAAGIGATAGLIVLVRQADVVFLLLIPMLGVSGLADLRARLAWLRGRWPEVAVAAGVLGVALLPQLWVWHVATGRWLTYSYGSSGFVYASSPRLAQVLFSFDPHGVLPWSPMLVLALAGLAPMWRRARPLFLPTLVILALVLYTAASWSFWWYAGGYGHRGFIDAYPLLAFGLAALYARLRAPGPRLAVAALSVAVCLLVSVQMIHYWQGLIPIDGIGFRQYVSLLGRPV
jgi:hypothetical protein